MYALILNSLRLSFRAAIVKISFYSWVAVCLNYSPPLKIQHRFDALQDSSHRSIGFLQAGLLLVEGLERNRPDDGGQVLTPPQSRYNAAHAHTCQRFTMVFLHQYIAFTVLLVYRALTPPSVNQMDEFAISNIIDSNPSI